MKYMGSKSRIKTDILKILQKLIDDNNIKTYIEPYRGGCNVIDEIKCDNRIANDNNEFLIEMLKKLTEDVNLINEDIFNEVPKELYDECRNRFNNYNFDEKYPKWYIGAIGFLASYNGRFYDGGYAKTVISKTGKVRNYYQEAKNNLINQLPKLVGIKWYNGDYTIFNDVTDALIYCDPPYENTKRYGTSKNFNHDKFWEWIKKMSKNNIVVVSSEIAPNDFKCIWEQEIIRTQDNRQRFKSIERMFMYEE